MSDRHVLCPDHGQRVPAIACRHLREAARTPKFVGWVQAASVPDSNEPGNLWAWCDACDEIYEADGDWTEENEVLADFRVVCDECFHRVHAMQASLRPGAA